MSKHAEACRAYIRKVQREQYRGATVRDLVKALGGYPGNITTTLHRMPDAYIAEWRASEGAGFIGRPAAVWRVVVPPPNAKPPVKRQTTAFRNAAKES
jgi:hypothetical protein